MRFVIFGAGAIGGWLGGGLLRGDNDVSFLARGHTLDALRRDGLLLREEDAETKYTVLASDDPLKLRGADCVIVGLKAHDVAGAAATLAALLEPHTLVLTIQNGLPWWFLESSSLRGRRLSSVDPEGLAARSIPIDQVLGGVVHGSSRALAPAVIQINKIDRLLIGDPMGGPSPRVDKLVEVFKAGNIPAAAVNDIRAELWAKLWGNMNMNPLSALTQAGAADILANPLLRELAAGMMREMEVVGSHLGLRLPMTVEQRIEVTGRLGNFRTSMLQDLDAGRHLEIEPILGVVVELASIVGVPVPLSSGVLGLTRQLVTSRASAST